MKKALLCELNMSEGIDQEKIEAVTRELGAAEDIAIIDVDSDKDRNRTVYTWVGEPESVLKGAFNILTGAIELINMAGHKSNHRRMGAIDVVPFVPVGNVSFEEAQETAGRFCIWLGSMGVPVYYYEEAAKRSERESLVEIRKGQYEALPEKMKDELRRPDEGPFSFVPKSGATVTGAPFPLIVFNVNLHPSDLGITKAIVARMRFSSGGLRFVRASAFRLKKSRWSRFP